MDERDRADAESIRRIRTGEPEACRDLVERHARRVHDLARRMLRDAHEAEDVTQQAFLNAWKALDRFDLDRPFRHWLLRIASNLCRNRLAQRKARRRTPRPPGGDVEVPEVAAPPAAARAADPALAARVRTAIEALPDALRWAVVLYYVHDLPVREIAATLDLPVGTVKTHLHRGRAALRDLLGPETPPDATGTEERT